MDTLFSSKNVFLFGAGKPDPALSYATVKIGSLGVRIDLVSERWTYLTVEVSKLEKKLFYIEHPGKTTDNKWSSNTADSFDVSSGFFQGDTLERVKNPEGHSLWLLNAALWIKGRSKELV